MRSTRKSSWSTPLWRWLPAVACMLIIFLLSARTGNDLDGWLPWAQKLFPGLRSFDPVHYFAYFALAVTFAYGFGFHRIDASRALFVVLFCVVYGATDEWHQAYVPGRSPDWADLLHDGIGALVAAVLLYGWRTWRQWRQKRGNTRNYSG
ncbi:VanZ family protein [Cohnella sp. REN36]|uniref:VanZ family protein n=1 Tax=Cohnella sp. REN36 TaxID=2887347 RepID=UPI001D159F81|nr:VanZ family protein [Cohnella sp. REN36]MCC3372955.1 VanZ family protein [Cohnella sp. REN36]